MIKYYYSSDPATLLTIEGDPDTICRKMGVLRVEVPDPVPPQNQYLVAYFQTTKALMRLAGQQVADTEWPKLEDVEYREISRLASAVDPETAKDLKDTLMYCFFQLKFAGLAWEQFEYPG